MRSSPRMLEENFPKGLRAGCRVKIHGLTKNPELNGQEGTVVRRLENQRWGVRHSEGASSVDTKNLELAVWDVDTCTWVVDLAK